jgi:hypothetical protein
MIVCYEFSSKFSSPGLFPVLTFIKHLTQFRFANTFYGRFGHVLFP